MICHNLGRDSTVPMPVEKNSSIRDIYEVEKPQPDVREVDNAVASIQYAIQPISQSQNLSDADFVTNRQVRNSTGAGRNIL